MCRDGVASTKSRSSAARRSRSCTSIGDAEHTGTTVTFWPDPEIFTDTTVYDYDTLAEPFPRNGLPEQGPEDSYCTDERANPGARVRRLLLSRAPRSFQYAGGIVDFVTCLNRGQGNAEQARSTSTAESADGTVEVAMQWSTSLLRELRSWRFANNINTHEGGTHLDGFKQAVTRTINEYARSQGHPEGEGQRTSPATTPARVWRPSSP